MAADALRTLTDSGRHASLRSPATGDERRDAVLHRRRRPRHRDSVRRSGATAARTGATQAVPISESGRDVTGPTNVPPRRLSAGRRFVVLTLVRLAEQMSESSSTVARQSIDELRLVRDVRRHPKYPRNRVPRHAMARARAIACTKVFSIAIAARHDSLREADWSTHQLPRRRTRRRVPCPRIRRRGVVLNMGSLPRLCGVVRDPCQLEGFASASDVLDVNNAPVPHVDHLKHLAPLRHDGEGDHGLFAVATLDHHRGRGGGGRRPQVVSLALESRPGLLPAVSIRVVLSAPPSRRTPPMHLIVEDLGERLHVARRQRRVGPSYSS